MTLTDELISRGEARVNNVRDMLVTAGCRLLDTRDDAFRRVRLHVRSAQCIRKDAINELVIPSVGRVLGRIADALEHTTSPSSPTGRTRP